MQKHDVKPYEGNLAEDCAAAQDQAHPLMRAVFAGFNDVFGDGKRDDARRERDCGGFYSEQTRG